MDKQELHHEDEKEVIIIIIIQHTMRVYMPIMTLLHHLTIHTISQTHINNSSSNNPWILMISYHGQNGSL
jgi:hypothetical protein